MTKTRLREIRSHAKTLDSTIRLMIEELCIHVESEGMKELQLDDATTHKAKARGTLDDFKTFARELKLPESDGDFMFHKFEANGWKGIKCWKSQIRAWKAASYLPSQKTQSNGHSTPRTTESAARMRF